MNAATLLAELEAAGIHVTREGDDLRVQGAPGVSLALDVERIRKHKPALLAELRLQAEIIQAATAATDAFDRRAYDELWHRWHVLERQELAL